jgi:hypothetical protein
VPLYCIDTRKMPAYERAASPDDCVTSWGGHDLCGGRSSTGRRGFPAMPAGNFLVLARDTRRRAAQSIPPLALGAGSSAITDEYGTLTLRRRYATIRALQEGGICCSIRTCFDQLEIGIDCPPGGCLRRLVGKWIENTGKRRFPHRGNRLSHWAPRRHHR